MKKKTGIGVGVAIVAFVIIFGIASLSDEVLLEPPSVATSEGQTGEEEKITIPSESISSTEQSEPEKITPVEQSEPEEETQENVIKVKINDGVGTQEK